MKFLERALFGPSAEHSAYRTELRGVWANAKGRTSDESPPSPGRPIEPPALCLGRDAQADLLLTALLGPKDVTVIVLGPVPGASAKPR
jgi:hypothetical protein